MVDSEMVVMTSLQFDSLSLFQGVKMGGKGMRKKGRCERSFEFFKKGKGFHKGKWARDIFELKKKGYKNQLSKFKKKRP